MRQEHKVRQAGYDYAKEVLKSPKIRYVEDRTEVSFHRVERTTRDHYQ